MASRSRRRAPASPERPWLRYLPWGVALIALATYLPALGGEFVNWDDDRNFLGNPDFRGLGWRNIEWAFSTFLLGHYHPLTWLSLELDFAIWGLEPAGYKLTNALLHAATAALVYLLFGELLRRARGETRISQHVRWGAAVGALLFALHPLRVESVAWASERRDVLSGLFYVLTVWLYVRGRLIPALLAFVAALLSKIIVATLPVVLLILDVYPLRRGLNTRTLLEKIPFFALSVGFGLVAIGRYEAGVSGATADLGLYPGLRAALSLWGLQFYLWKTLWPFDLYALYVPTADPSAGDLRFLVAAAFVVAMTAAAVWLWVRGKPWLAAAWAAYCITLAPVLSLLRLDRQQAVADHHSYLATLGFAALAGGGWVWWRERRPRPAAWAATAALGVLAILTVRQIATWQDSVTLWARTVDAYPQAVVARNNLGRALAEQGRAEQALTHFQAALEVEPDYVQANYNLGLMLMQQERLQEAETALRKAVALEPQFAQAWSDLGNCLLRQRRIEEAIAAYDRALEADPGHADASHNRALAVGLLSGER